MTNLYPFIQGSLEWPFGELFSANASLWNQYKYIEFFSCRIVMISYKMLIITGISNEKTNELTTYGILCWNVTIFYWHKLVYLFQLQEKSRMCRSSKLNFLSSCSFVHDSHVKLVWWWWGKKTCIKMSQSEVTVEFIKKRKRNDLKEGQDQVLPFWWLKCHFDKKFEASNKTFSVETKHLVKRLKSQRFHPLIKRQYNSTWVQFKSYRGHENINSSYSERFNKSCY